MKDKHKRDSEFTQTYKASGGRLKLMQAVAKQNLLIKNWLKSNISIESPKGTITQNEVVENEKYD